MKRIALNAAIVLAVVGLAFGTSGASPRQRPAKAKVAPESDVDRYVREMTVTSYLLIVGSSKDFHAARKQALQIARKTGIPYSDDDRTWDRKYGWGYWKYQEMYISRRYDWTRGPDGRMLEPYISVEKSDFYPGLRPGRYIIVAGVLNKSDCRSAVAKMRRHVPDAYAARTRIYMGCRS